MYRKKLRNSMMIAVVLLLMIFGVSGCFFGSPNVKMVAPLIRALGLPDASVVGSVSLKVTGPDMDPVKVSYSTLPGVINISIPEGTDRTFELTVTTGNGYAGAVTTYKGITTADIASDRAVITLNMGIGSTKIVVPDAYNYRVVQIDNMSGTGWTALKWSDLGFGNNYEFLPYDVDMDQYGNIYIANNYSSTGGIYKIDSMLFRSSVQMSPGYYHDTGNGSPAAAVSADQKNDRIYGLIGGSVYYWSYDGLPLGGTVFFTPSGEYVAGIAVDKDGNVYLGGDEGNGGPWITKYSSGGSLLAVFSQGGPSYTVSDITILNNKIYATLNGSSAQIEEFDSGLNSLGFYGSPGAEGTKGKFVGPHNFVAVLNKKLTLIDGTDFSAQLVSFDDISGGNWETYGTWDNAGNGTGVFKFFSNC